MKISSLRTRAVQLLMSVVVVLIAASPEAAQGADGFVYVLRNDTVVNGGSHIYGYRVEPATGLTALSGFPVATGEDGLAPLGVSEGIVIDRANRRLYAINMNSRTVSAFSIAPTTGTLTALPFSPIRLGAAPSTEIVQCLAVHPSGSPLVVASRFIDPVDMTLNGRAYRFNVTATTATAAVGSPYLTGADTHPLSCEFSRDGASFYSGGFNGQRFAGFAVDASTGVLTPLAGSPFLSGDSTGSFATDDSGRLFAADISETVRAHTTSAGIPTEVSSADRESSQRWRGTDCCTLRASISLHHRSMRPKLACIGSAAAAREGRWRPCRVLRLRQSVGSRGVWHSIGPGRFYSSLARRRAT
jgi:hypothetical protein